MTESCQLSRRAFLAGAGAAATAPTILRAAASPATRSVRVPLDHTDPLAGSIDLGFGELSPFDPNKRTVFVIADGQQFYVTPASFARSVGPVFGDAFNVVGVFGRADMPEVQAQVGWGEDVDWARAYQLLRADQWLADLDTVRRSLLGPEGRIALYGRSGGGLLVHQFMARYGERADAVFTQAAVNPFIEARFGLTSDRFWEELDDGGRMRLSGLLRSGRFPRRRIAALFQRQNFFVAREDLAAERAATIDELSRGDEAAIEQRETDYQIDALAALDRTPRGPAMHVRLFEFFAPRADRYSLDDAALHPDIEVTAGFAEPLTALMRAGRIAPSALDLSALPSRSASVCLLAGRWDHTCDYRTQLALASAYPNGRLILLDDDHVFHRLAGTGVMRRLVNGALEGVDSPDIADALRMIAPLIWRETD